MSVPGDVGPPVALAPAMALLVLQRVGELVLARRNARIVRAWGAIEHAAEQLPWFVALHAAFSLALVCEVLALRTRPGPAWPAWLAALVAAEALRYAAIRALGPWWNVRILVRPGAAPVRRGPYRWLRHPNYVAVVVELAALPMLFGAWRTAVAFSAANLILLAWRIPAEERALGLREAPSPASPLTP